MLGSSIRSECPQFFPRYAPPLSPTSATKPHCLHPCADETWRRPSDGHRQCIQVARNDRPRAFSNLALIVTALLKFLILWENGEKVIAFERDQEAAYVLPCRTAAHKRRRSGNVRIHGQEVAFHRRRLVKTVGIKDEWNQDVKDLGAFIEALKRSRLNPDLFTFWQRPTDPQPKYPFYREPEPVAILPIRDYQYWVEQQINKGARQALARARRRGVDVKVVKLDDNLVNGITAIYNETPIRQGRPFTHYGKMAEAVRRLNETYLDCSEFLGAYHGPELIGFMKLTYMENYVDTMGLLSKIAHRDKSPTNALIARAVERCHEKGMTYLCYGEWSGGGLGAFKSHNGFQRFELPRYYVPLTVRGKIVLALRLHRDIVSFLPQQMLRVLIHLRTNWYSRLTPPDHKRSGLA